MTVATKSTVTEATPFVWKEKFRKPELLTGSYSLTITPELAEEWLSRNAGNRRLNTNFVLELAEAIELGQYVYNGETIKFSKTGVLLDGQNRLTAVTLAKKPVESVVVFGLEDEARNTVDTGTKRTGAHVLQMASIANSHKTSATMTLLYRYFLNRWSAKGRLKGPTHSMLMDMLKDCDGYEPSVRVGITAHKLMPASVGAATHYLFSRVNPEQADFFFQKLIHGEGLERKNPIYAVRERLARFKSGPAKLSSNDTFMLVVKAWNLYRTESTAITVRMGDNEECPKVDGLTWVPKCLQMVRKNAKARKIRGDQ